MTPRKALPDKRKSKPRPLNAKQRAFRSEYLKDKNATQAAIRAGYSPRTAGAQGHDLLKKPEISDWIAEQTQRIEDAALDSAGLTRELVLTRLRQLVDYDEADAYDKETGLLLPIHEIPLDCRAAIVALKVREEVLGAKSSAKGNGSDEGASSEAVLRSRITEVRFADRKGPIELAMRHLNLLGDEGNPDAGAMGERVVRLPNKAGDPDEWAKRALVYSTRMTPRKRKDK